MKNPVNGNRFSENCVMRRIGVGQGFQQAWYQGMVKATVSGVFEDLKFKISGGSDQN